MKVSKIVGLAAALAIAAGMVLFSSCSTSDPDGLWDPIKLDKAELHFLSEGGEQTVTMKNYSMWWINGGYEQAVISGGVLDYVNYVTATSSDGEGAYTYDLLDGGWYRAVVPDKGKSNKLIVTTEPNYTAKPREAFIAMEAGDAFTTVKIYQP